MAKSIEILLEEKHLLPEPPQRDVFMGNGPKQEIYGCMAIFMHYWRTLDRVLYTNDAFINGIRSGELDAFHGRINGQSVTVEQAYTYGQSIGDQYKKMEEQSKSDWEDQFSRSQNWLRMSTLAQTYLIWEDHIRDRFLEIINFEHDEIGIGKEIATIRSDTFGDLMKIRNSMWHAKSSTLGICMFNPSELREIGDMVDFEKDKILTVSAEQLPKLAFHISSKLQQFPVGYKLCVDKRKVHKQSKKTKSKQSNSIGAKILDCFSGNK